MSLKASILGASGYTGFELAKILQHHPDFELASLYVSANSQDANKSLSDLDGRLSSDYFEQSHLQLSPLDNANLVNLASSMDAVFLATPHEASHDWMPQLLGKKAKIFDLSGAFRLSDVDLFEQFYGFSHQAKQELAQAVYGLAEWNFESISNAQLVAVPGCYPTASLLALKPVAQNSLIDNAHYPIINAVSGVSGAGRKATMTNSFCEVSLQAYGVLGHRHQPEISEHLGNPVIFTPHLGNFKRGILATITVKTSEGVTASDVEEAFSSAYQGQPFIKLCSASPKLENVVGGPQCHIYWKLDESTGYLVLVSAIDNLLKGAASQAIQCANLSFGLQQEAGLLGGLL